MYRPSCKRCNGNGCHIGWLTIFENIGGIELPIPWLVRCDRCFPILADAPSVKIPVKNHEPEVIERVVKVGPTFKIGEQECPPILSIEIDNQLDTIDEYSYGRKSYVRRDQYEVTVRFLVGPGSYTFASQMAEVCQKQRGF